LESGFGGRVEDVSAISLSRHQEGLGGELPVTTEEEEVTLIM